MADDAKLTINSRVIINGKPEFGTGTVKYLGVTKFSDGRWVGIELDSAMGKNDGTVKGDKYFDCKPAHGLFVKPQSISIVHDDSGSTTTTADVDMPTIPTHTTSKPVATRPPSSTGSRPSIGGSNTPTTTTTTTSNRPPSSLSNRPAGGTSGLKKPTESGLKKPTTTSTSTGTGTTTSTSNTPHTSRPSSPTPPQPDLTLDDLKKPAATTTATEDKKSTDTKPTSIRPPSSSSTHSATEEKKSTDTKTTTSGRPPSSSSTHPTTVEKPATTSTPTPVSTQPSTSNIKPPTTTTTSSSLKQPVQSGIKPPTTTTTTTSTPTPISEPLTVAQLTSTPSSAKKPKIVEGEEDEDDEQDDDDKDINNLLNKSLRAAEKTPIVVNENIEKLMNTINELSDFKLKSQSQISDLQDQIRELSSTKDKISKDYEKQIQQLEKTILAKEKDYDNLLKSQHKHDESNEKLLSKEKEAFEKEKALLLEQIDRLNSDYELLTLDKELVNEKLEFSELELEASKEELELLKVDYENLKIEVEASKKTIQIDQSLPTDIAVLQEQNEKLKETLVKLRDMALNEKHEYAKKFKDFEETGKLLKSTQEKCIKTDAELVKRLEEILELKQALEDAESQEGLITDLTEKNLELSEELEEIKNICQDLESFKDLSEELAENQTALEKQLRMDINAKEVENLNLNVQLTNQNVKIQEFEKTINQYRDLVSKLHHKLEEMKRREDEQYEQHTNFNVLQQQLLNKNQELQTQVIKATSLEIDHQLDQYKAKEAELHLSFISAYLPEQSFQADNDSIKLVLGLKRIVLKSELAQKYLNRTYKVEEIAHKLLQSTSGSGNPNEINESLIASSNEVAHSLQVIHILDHLIISATWLSETLDHCTVENWLKSGRSTKDINRQEIILDHLLGQIKEEHYGPSYSSSDLEKITMKLDSILGNIFGEAQIFKSEWSMILNHILNIQYYLKQIMLNDINVTNQIQSANTSFPQKEISRLLSICRKVVKNLLTKPNLKHSSVIRDILKFSENSCSSILSDLTLSIPRVVDQSISQEILISQMNTRVESILLNSNTSFSQKSSSLTSSTEEFELDNDPNQVNEDTLSPMEKLFNRMIVQLNDIVESILAGDLNEDPNSIKQQQQKPWIVRSIQLKQSLGEVGNLYNTIASKEQELLENLKAIKTKDAELIEEKRKEEIFDKRIKILQKAEGELAQQMEKEVQLREKNEKAYKQAIQLLRKDSADYIEENKQLKQKITNLVQEHKKMTSNLNAAATKEGSIESLRQIDDIQVITLKKTIKFLRNENIKLKHEKSVQQLSTLLPVLPSNKLDESSEQDDSTVKNNSIKFTEILEFSKAISETMNSILESTATPKVIDITSSDSKTDTLGFNVIEKQIQFEKLQARNVQLLKSKMPNVVNISNNSNGGPLNLFNPVKSLMIKNSIPKQIGKISIPTGFNNSLLLDDDIKKAVSSNILPINLFTNPKSFNEIHQVFVN